MKALSIQQPWSGLIVHGIKDIENRDWSTDYRGLILIHAGKKVDEDAKIVALIRAFAPERLEEMMLRAEYPTGGIVGYATLQKVVTQSESPWFRGKYGFVLTQRHPIDFIPLRGRLGLFDVPREIEEHINTIRDQRALEDDMKDMAKIRQEWYEYAHEGDETPPTPPSILWGK